MHQNGLKMYKIVTKPDLPEVERSLAVSRLSVYPQQPVYNVKQFNFNPRFVAEPAHQYKSKNANFNNANLFTIKLCFRSRDATWQSQKFNYDGVFTKI